MDNLVIYVPIAIIGIIVLQIVLRVYNKATINKVVESDWQKKQRLMRERVASRKQRSKGGTKFKSKLINNPNEKKWDKLKASPLSAKKKRR